MPADTSRDVAVMPRRAISSVNDRNTPGPAVHRPRRDERPPAALAVDETGDGQLLHGLADGHPADVEAGAQLGLGRQGVAGRSGGDQPAQVGLDVAVAGAAR